MSTKKGYKLVPWLFGKEIEIPEEWEVKKLEEVGEIIGGGTPDSTNKDFWNGDILWAVPTDITKLQVNQIENTERKITKLGLENSSAKLLPAKTILITSRATIGECAITTKPITTNQGFQNIICNDKHNNYLIFYLIKHFPNNLLRLSQGTTFLEINKNQMKKVIVPISNDIKEQQKIATILSNVDSLIDSTRQVIKNSKSLKTGLMQKLLTRGISHTKFKKVPWSFGKEIEIPEEWEVLPLSKICNIRETDSIKSDLYVGLEHISQNDNKLVGQATTKEFTSNTNSFHNNDVLYGKLRPLLNKVWLATEDGHCSTDILPLQTKDNIIPTILLLVLTDYRFFWYAVSTSSGTKMPRTNWLDMKNFLVFLPSVLEQQKIANILSNIDAQIDSQTQYKEKLERLKKSLMQKLLTGEVRV